jgi:hypothetical protein
MQWMCTVLHTSCTTQRWQVVSTQHTSTPSSKPCNTVKIDGNQYARWHHTCMHGVSSRAHAYPHVHALTTFTMCGINNVRERSVLTKTANVAMFCTYTRPPDTNTPPHSFTCLRVIAHIAQTKRQGACRGVRTQRPLRHASTHALHCTICVLAHAWLDHPIQTGQCRADNADADGCNDVNMNNERGETTRSLSLAGLSTAVPRKIRPTHAQKRVASLAIHGAVSSRLSPHRRLNTAPCRARYNVLAHRKERKSGYRTHCGSRAQEILARRGAVETKLSSDP